MTPSLSFESEQEKTDIVLGFQRSMDEIYIVACNKDRTGIEICGYLLKFSPDGTIHLCENVNHGIGLRLDENGSIICANMQ